MYNIFAFAPGFLSSVPGASLWPHHFISLLINDDILPLLRAPVHQVQGPFICTLRVHYFVVEESQQNNKQKEYFA